MTTYLPIGQVCVVHLERSLDAVNETALSNNPFPRVPRTVTLPPIRLRPRDKYITAHMRQKHTTEPSFTSGRPSEASYVSFSKRIGAVTRPVALRFSARSRSLLVRYLACMQSARSRRHLLLVHYPRPAISASQDQGPKKETNAISRETSQPQRDHAQWKRRLNLHGLAQSMRTYRKSEWWVQYWRTNAFLQAFKALCRVAGARGRLRATARRPLCV